RSSHTSDLLRTDDLLPAKIYLSDLIQRYHRLAMAPAASPPSMANAPLSAAADAAHLSSTGASGDEDIKTRETQEASPAEEENDENTEPWITVTKRARRRGQQPRSTTPPLPLPPLKPALQQSRPKVRKPRPPPLPADDFKLAIRPRNGLQLNKVSPGKLVDAIALAAQLQIGATEFKVRLDADQNILVLSTSSQATASTLSKGVIYNIAHDTTPEMVLQRIAAPGYEALTCRRLGNTTTMVITFLGKRVPYYIKLSGFLIRCYLYKRTVPHCRTCHEIGHRADVCPRPPVAPKCRDNMTATPDALCAAEITRRQPNLALNVSSRPSTAGKSSSTWGTPSSPPGASAPHPQDPVAGAQRPASPGPPHSAEVSEEGALPHTVPVPGPSRSRTPGRGRSASARRGGQGAAQATQQVSWAQVVSPEARPPPTPQKRKRAEKPEPTDSPNSTPQQAPAQPNTLPGLPHAQHTTSQQIEEIVARAIQRKRLTQTYRNPTCCKDYPTLTTSMAATQHPGSKRKGPRGETTAWQWNCRGYKNRYGSLTQYVSTSTTPPELIALQEKNTQVRLPGYVTYGTDTSNSLHTLVSKRLVAVQHHLQQSEPLAILLEIIPPATKKKNPMFLLNIYCWPKSPPTILKHVLEEATHTAANNPLLIVGDFNAAHPLWGYAYANPWGNLLHKLIEDMDLTLVTDPTNSTRLGTSVTRDTSPDLTFTKTSPKLTGPTWRTTTLHGLEYKARIGTARLIDWVKMRETRTQRPGNEDRQHHLPIQD
ncbi:hypothetical protein HPB47_001005, partial [Ixodes persulcatus]